MNTFDRHPYLKTPTCEQQPSQTVKLACPTCDSDCNERDELIKAEREIQRLQQEVMLLRNRVGIGPQDKGEEDDIFPCSWSIV